MLLFKKKTILFIVILFSKYYLGLNQKLTFQRLRVNNLTRRSLKANIYFRKLINIRTRQRVSFDKWRSTPHSLITAFSNRGVFNQGNVSLHTLEMKALRSRNKLCDFVLFACEEEINKRLSKWGFAIQSLFKIDGVIVGI